MRQIQTQGGTPMDVLQEIARLRTGEKIQAIFFMAAFVFMVFSGVG